RDMCGMTRAPGIPGALVSCSSVVANATIPISGVIETRGDGLLASNDFHGSSPFFCIQWVGLEAFPCPLLCL
ncbi:MAG: hypothetical protein K2P41_00670, partial [Lachnospiraceae bacterium]|nr:hypothetical protein [Lachnospiraceae bacterium]